MFSKLSILIAGSLVLCAGCQSPPPRTIAGALSSSYDGRLDNPVVIARALDGRSFASAVTSRGAFRITVPSGATYRLTLANKRPAGDFKVLSRINWPGSSTWAKVGAGRTILLGTVRPAAAGASSGLSTSADEDVHGTNPCGAADGECIEDVDVAEGVQECQWDDGEVGNTDDAEVIDNVELVADTPEGDKEIDNDANRACTTDAPGAPGSSSTDGSGGTMGGIMDGTPPATSSPTPIS